MKKQAIAVMLSIMMAAGSLGGIPVLAAEDAAAVGGTISMESAAEEQPEQSENSQESKDADYPAEDTQAEETQAEEDTDKTGSDGEDSLENLMESSEESYEDVEEAQEETFSAPAAMSVVDSGTCGNDLTWTLDDEGTLTISGTGWMNNYNPSNPAPYAQNDSIKKVIITDGVTGIGAYAFSGCKSLTSVTIPSSVTSIRNQAFSECSSLTSVTIQRGVKSIGDQAFSGCSGLISATLPDSVTSIGNQVYFGCSGLTSVTIPGSVTSIGDQAFYGCSSLTSVTIPSSVTSIGKDAFGECSGLNSILVESENPAYCSPDGVLLNKEQTEILLYPNHKEGSYSIPESVISIGERAFYGCSGLTGVTIPGSVTSIGNRAFETCSLTSVTIPGSVTSIGYRVFYGCIGLTDVTISSGVASIGSSAFETCSGLTSVTIPGSVTSIGADAFSGCIGLESLTIMSGVTSIGENAFFGCSGLTSVTIPDSVTSIEKYAFSGCSGLTSVTIPDSVTSMEGYVFSGCSSLTSVSIPNSVTEISERTFSECSSLTSVTIPSGVMSIWNCAFSGCISLTSVTIPDSVTRIAHSAFSGCRGLSNIIVDTENPAYSSDDAVLFNKDHTIIVLYPDWIEGGYSIPEGVLSIGNGAFFGCSNLTSVTIPGSVTSIGSEAFYKCSSLASVTIPNSVTSLSYNVFYGCSSLASLYFDGNAPDIGRAVFYGVTATAYYPANDATWTEDKIQNYGGTITWVGYKNIDECDISLAEDSVVYTGEELKPEVVIRDGSQQLAKEQDYTVQYESNVNAGTATMTITGKKHYRGTVSKTFTIAKASPVLEFASPAVEKKDTDEPFTNELTKTTDGTVTFESGDTAVAEVDSSTGTVTIKGIGTATITAAAAEGTNYTSGSASYTLTVTKDGVELKLEDLTYSFANSALSFGYPKDYVVPLSSYQAIFGDTTKAAWYFKIQSAWGGSCMGFSSTAALLFDPDNGLYPSGFNPGAGRISDLKVQDENSSIGMDITGFIEAMQIAQKTQQVKDTIASNRVYTTDINAGRNDLNGICNTVKEQTKAGIPVIIAVYQNGGHAILAYKTEDVSGTERRIYVYDNNFPSSERYITLNKDSSGNYTSWSYDMGGYGTWGTSDRSSSISYVPYSVIEHVWNNRGDVNEIQNVVRFNSQSVALYDRNNKLAATIVNGEVATNDKRIRIVEDDLEAGGSAGDGYTLLSMPIDVYTVRNLDSSVESLELSVVDTNLGASVDTTADEVTFVVDDSNDLNSILIKAEEDDSYRIELNSSFDNGHDVEIKGYGNGETLEVSQESGYISINNCQILNITVDGVEVEKYTVSASSGENGSISPSGESTVIRDMDTTYTITPDNGYVVDDVKVDGKSVGAVSSYTFKQVRADHTISATFKKSVTLPGKTTRGDMFNLANNVKVTWKAVTGAKYYKVYREGITDPAETRKEPVIVTAGLVGWDKDPGLTNGHAYRYKIVASLTGRGDSSGDSLLSYSKLMYRLKTVVIRSVKNTAPGKVTVKYDKTASGDSYVLQYCERQDMVGAKTKVVLGASNTSYVIGGLKKGKTYYISIRVRKKVNGIDYYTTFGVPKKVTVAK